MPEKAESFKRIKDMHPEKWEKLSQKKIYFGHQSVGFNIIDGIGDVLKRNQQIQLNILETNDPAAFDGPVFAHSRIGENADPGSKNEAFINSIETGIGNTADVAFFKYCYVDVRSDADVDALFENYRVSMARLKKNYPHTTFVHVTVPLVVVQKDWRVLVKRIIGRPIGGYADNIKRNQFSALMRKEYEGREAVFDLARIEATHPDGRMETFHKDGKRYLALVPEYASDGRHLNETGRSIVAEQLLIFLVNLTDEES